MTFINKFCFVILLWLANACTPGQVKIPPSATARIQSSDEALQSQLEEIHAMQTLVEQALVLRSKAIKFYQAHALKEKQAGYQIPLTPAELSKLYDGARTYLDVREKLRAIGIKHSWLADPHFRVIFSHQDQNVTESEPGRNKTFPKKQPLYVNIESTQGRLLMLQLKTSLGAALVLYDNYLMAIYPFTKNRKYSYLFNRDFRSYLTDQANQYTEKNLIQKLHYKITSLVTLSGKLDELTSSYLNGTQRKKIVAAMEILDDYDKAIKSLPDYRVTDEEAYLDLLREQSYTYKLIRIRGKFNAGGRPYLKRLSQIQENLLFFSNAFSFILSEGFGNGIGLIAFRDGKLRNLPDVEKQDIANRLQPLDILIEKTPFRLTDAFIPGHYGHVAIWVGGYSDYEKLGLKDHPLVKKYEDQLKSGHSVVESLRSGVQMNSLEHFLNIDDLLVLRPKKLSLDEQRDFQIEALKQVGKEYDYNFNVETREDIVCSELAYVVFKNVEWPTKKSLGRFTISPDHVARKALNGAFDIILIYHDGKKVEGNLSQALYTLLEKSPALTNNAVPQP